MQDYEKLGAFYLGRQFDLDADKVLPDLMLYDSKDLTTHAVCVGMTGSGKTGLCLSLLEEAAIDGIPSICIDPKGDLGNLMLTFPNLAPGDFRPWVDDGEAVRKGMTPDQFAAHTAEMWRAGLASWGQEPDRIARFRQSADVSIYTPGGSAGLPLTVLRSFSAPPQEVLDDADAFRERVAASVSGLLALMKIDADPIQSREFILLSNILEHAWRSAQNIDLPGLIHAIQAPPMQKVGFLDLETFYPQKDRFSLAMRVNNLLASPSFAAWSTGEPLNVQNLLYTRQGKPRVSILSIAHLSEPERMFFVTILLNEILAWVRTQSGTSSLRAMLYMDEVFGYFPPTANPPSKTPMLTLLKQARAYGLGVMLATQNPVDLDYKGLANTGTWFLGRLQTQRDKERVLEGLEGASAESGAAFDRQKMEATLAGLGSRVFLMNNVHDDAPVVFQTRWALSYLRGPLTRDQIGTLMAERKAAVTTREAEKAASVAAAMPAPTPLPQAAPAASTGTRNTGPAPDTSRPVLPPGVKEKFLARRSSIPSNGRLVYRPAVLASARMHFVRVTYKIDEWFNVASLAPLAGDDPPVDWSDALVVVLESLDLESEPDQRGEFAPAPACVTSARSFGKWETALKSHLYQSQLAHVWRCNKPKQYSEANEPEGKFRIRLTDLVREERDLLVEKMRAKYNSKLKTLTDRIRNAEQRIEKEKAQYRSAQFSTAISFGTSILSAVFGRKVVSTTNISKAGTAMRGVSRTFEQKGDIGEAEADAEALRDEFADLEREFKEEIDALESRYTVDAIELERLEVRPRKSDIAVEDCVVLWTPWIVDAVGIAEPAYDIELMESDEE